MPTLIDSLLIQIGLDSSQFTKGQQKVVQQTKQLEEEVTRRGKITERALTGISDAISEVRNHFMRLGAAVIGAASFEQLAVKTVTNTAALGRFASVLGISTELLSKWQIVGKIVTGTTEGMAEAVGGAVKMFAQFAIQGGTNPWLRAMQTLTGKDFRRFLDSRNELKDATGFFQALTESFEKLKDHPGEMAVFADNLPFMTPQMQQVMAQGPAALAKHLATAEMLGPIREAERKQAQEVVEAWGEASEKFQPIARAISLISAKGVIEVLTKIEGIFENMAAIAKAIPGITPPGPGQENRAWWQKGGSWDRYFGTDLPVKGNAGNQSAGTAALARSIYANVPGIKQFTSFNDDFHKDRNSAHNKGNAFDFTLEPGVDPRQKEAEINRYLASIGANAKVSFHPKGYMGSTADHLHAQFANSAAAAGYVDAARGGGGVTSTTNNRSSEVTIGTVSVNVNMMGSNDPKRISDEIVAGVSRRMKAAASGYADR